MTKYFSGVVVGVRTDQRTATIDLSGFSDDDIRSLLGERVSLSTLETAVADLTDEDWDLLRRAGRPGGVCIPPQSSNHIVKLLAHGLVTGAWEGSMPGDTVYVLTSEGRRALEEVIR